jgi:hypothetical protein
MEPDLSNWIVETQGHSGPQEPEQAALSVLLEECDYRGSRSEGPAQLSEEKLSTVKEILKLDEPDLRKRWNLPDEDSYKRYDYDPSLFSDMPSFIQLFDQKATEEIQWVKRSLYYEMLTFDGRTETTNYRVSKEASVLFRLRKYPDFVE